MAAGIQFPNIGINLKHVGYGISIFGFEIAYYGILIGLAVLLGTAAVMLEARRTRQDEEEYLGMALYVVSAGIIGARLFYVIFDWGQFKGNFLRIFNIREGGLAFYGGLLAGLLTVCIFAYIREMPVMRTLDTVCMGVLAGQVIGVWGNFYNRESFGEYTDGLFAMRLPMDALRASDVTERMRNHIEMAEGVRYVQAHPMFLYESIWCLILLIVLLIYSGNKKFDGEVFWMYLGGYGLGRSWMEGLRTDKLLIPGTQFAVSQVLSVLFVIAAVIFIVRGRLDSGRNRRRRIGVRRQETGSLNRQKNIFSKKNGCLRMTWTAALYFKRNNFMGKNCWTFQKAGAIIKLYVNTC